MEIKILKNKDEESRQDHHWAIAHNCYSEKPADLNCTSIELAMRVIAGMTANMGIEIDPPVLEPKMKELV